jgi:GAF domain-containing protein
MAQMLRDLPPAVKAGAPAAAAAPQVSPAHGQSPADVPVAVAAGHPVQAPRAPHLSAAAEVCVDLAKVVDAEDVPALLDRTAAVLDAKGIVIWAVDADGARLRPSLSHGYSDRVLAKLRPLQIDGDNVTSLAYRSLQPQAINGATPADSAALAVPLLTGTGCVGVMAVELRHNRPHADLLSIARIVAAQLSALIAPPEDSVPKTAHASS